MCQRNRIYFTIHNPWRNVVSQKQEILAFTARDVMLCHRNRIYFNIHNLWHNIVTEAGHFNIHKRDVMLC
jgi:hypothetical protein